MPFTPADLEVAQAVFDVIVAGEPRRAHALDPVIRWPKAAWSAFTEAMRIAGFDSHKPSHLSALQSLIDKACDA